MELWNWLSEAMDLTQVERLLAKNQNEMEAEYNNFVQWPVWVCQPGDHSIRP